MLFDAGASEVHVRISSPPVIGPCFYGIDLADESELIAASPLGRGGAGVDRRDLARLHLARRPSGGDAAACLGAVPRVPYRRLPDADPDDRRLAKLRFEPARACTRRPGGMTRYVHDLELDPVRVVEEHRVVARDVRVLLAGRSRPARPAPAASPPARRPRTATVPRRPRGGRRSGSDRTAPRCRSAPRGARASYRGRRCTRSSRRARPRPRRPGASRAAPGARGRTAGCGESN